MTGPLIVRAPDLVGGTLKNTISMSHVFRRDVKGKSIVFFKSQVLSEV